MVKNTSGGSGHKSMARKNIEPSRNATKRTRVSLEDGEIYAKVTAVLGNGMCHVLCLKNVKRLCFFRGKFKGKGKRDNSVGPGRWLLVGIRDYESEKTDKLPNCDLLEVYSDHDMEWLKQQPNLNFSSFMSAPSSSAHEGELISFRDDEDADTIMSAVLQTKGTKMVLVEVVDHVEEDINVDDI